MKKKLLLLLTLCFAAVVLTMSVVADNGETLTVTDDNGIVWEYETSDKVLRISLGKDYTSTVIEDIPRELLPDHRFVETLVIEEGITEIKEWALAGELIVFQGELTTVTLPVSMTSIGSSNFDRYPKLEEVNYRGSDDQWDAIEIAKGNCYLLGAKPQSVTGGTLSGNADRSWSIDINGKLIVSGSGDITDAPWLDGNGQGLDIHTVEIENAYSVKSICAEAFAGCANLVAIELPVNVTEIKDETFSSCHSLRGVQFPERITRIGEKAFYGCSLITELDIPDSVTYIGDSAFESCLNLKSIDLPANLETMGSYVFKGCATLKSLDIPGITSINPIGVGSSTSNLITSVETVKLSEGTKIIGDGAFQSCWSLSDIYLPSTLESVGNHAFGYCYGLERVHYNGDADSWKDVRVGKNNDYLLAALPFGSYDEMEYVIDEATGTLTVTGSGELTSTLHGKVPWYRYIPELQSVYLSYGITNIPEGAFSGASQLTTIEIPSSVKFICSNAFTDCTSLKSIVIPDSVTKLESAFSGCTALESVTLSKRLSSIEGATFQNCSSLKSITLPDAVTSIGANAFDGCTSLTSVTTGDFINTVGASAFDNCPRLTLHVYDGSYMQAYAEAYDLDYEIIPGTEQEVTGIENITSSTGVNPETGEVCTVMTITLSDGRTQKFYLDNEVNSIEDITSRPGFDPDGKPCTVVTITMTNGDVERFYVYDGKDGEDGETVVTPIFNDVPATAYYADAVAWAVANGITTGTDENTFSPNASCTRAQVVTFLWRAMGSPEPRSAGTFTDVNASSYYAKAVRWALENGITSGTSATTFDPNAVCTRAQVVTFLMRALDGRSYGSAGFADVAASSYYADAVAWAVANGITDGTGATTFSPDTQCNRAQIVTFLYRAVA